MEDNRTNRRLVAILAADVVGYSRLMGADETGTLAALKAHREQVFDPAVTHHQGRIVKLIGDGTLVEFGSVVDAVSCALDIQRAMHAQPGEGGIRLRIGIHLGDVILDGDDIYGDGVNIAARLEPLAEAGGICVSSIVRESVGRRAGVDFQDKGEVALKNIQSPFRVWTWHPGTDAEAPAAPAPTAAAPAPTGPSTEDRKPSIAVLPFTNMSGDEEQEYFSDGITEDLITDLSKVGGLLVIARNSSFAYKGRHVDIRTVGRELGVSNVLEGSIRRAGNRVRITGQLIDAGDGTHLWAERYDRDMTDIFAVQDEVTQKIVHALKVTLTPAEAARIAAAPTTNVEAHDLFLRGREALLVKSETKESFEKAVDLFNQAIDLDPDYAEPYAGLAHAYNHDYQNGWSGRTDSRDLSDHYVKVALEKDPDLSYAHAMAASAAFWRGDLAEADRAIDRALALNPSSAFANTVRGFIRVFQGKPAEALPQFERTLRLDPLVDHLIQHSIGSAHLVAGDYEKAADAFRKRIEITPDTDLSRGLLISALGHLGRIEEARQVHAELKRVNPGYSFARHIARLPFSDPADAETLKQGYASAGIDD